jgi:hypothetical protein
MIASITIRLLLLAASFADDAPKSAPVHVVSLIADHNSVFRVMSEKKSEIDLIAGESVLLHVYAQKATSMNRDGSVHGLLLLDSRHKPVAGWDLLFKPGVQDMQLTAPKEPGTYEAVCTVVCSADHDQMKLKVVVTSK